MFFFASRDWLTFTVIHILVIMFGSVRTQQLNEACTTETVSKIKTITCYQYSTLNSFINTTSLQNTSFEYTLKISNKIYPKIPALAFQWIRINQLSIIYSGIQFVDERAFENILSLNELTLNSNNILSIDSLLLGLGRLNTALNNFIRLNLDYNFLSKINTKFPSSMSKLERLLLDSNRIETLSAGLLEELVNLKLLSLKNNSIKQLEPFCFRGLRNLQTLVLDSNPIARIDNDDVFYGLEKLKLLQLGATNIEEMKNVTLRWFTGDLTITINKCYLKVFRVLSYENFTSVAILNLPFNLIERLDNFMFKPFGRLTYLDIDNNKISVIEKSAFVGLKALATLTLSGNQIFNLEHGTFSDLGQLSRLSLMQNSLKTIDKNTLIGLSSLNSIELSKNSLEAIGAYTFEPTGKLTKTDFDLSSQLIRLIEPFAFYRLNSALILNLDDNQLTNIQDNSFYGLVNLEELHLNINSISLIEKLAFFGLKSLQYLYLGDNKITYIDPSVFGNLTSLRVLFLDSNPLFDLDLTIFSNLRSLVALQLASCTIRRLNSRFFGMENSFTELNMIQNKISVIKGDLFNRLYKLQTLELGQNEISAIEFNSFENLTQLVTLNLSYNCISKLDPRLFRNNKMLANIYLSHNLILDIESSTFQNLPKLASLDLATNKIMEFSDKQLINSTTSLTTLRLSDNFLYGEFVSNGLNKAINLFLDLNNLNTVKLLNNIKSLNLSGNPDLEILQFKSITSLSSSHNKLITNLSGSSEMLNSIQTLQLVNVTTELLSSIKYSSLISLQTLDLSSNNLTGLPIFKQMKTSTLQNINLSQSNANITQLALIPLTSLVSIDLGHNQFEYAHVSNLLNNTKVLEYAYLNNLNLSSATLLSSISTLKRIDLSYNSIVNITTDTFANNIQLTYLNLSHNQIWLIADGSFKLNRILNILDLSHNRIIEFYDFSRPGDIRFFNEIILGYNPGLKLNRISITNTIYSSLRVNNANLSSMLDFAEKTLVNNYDLSNNRITLVSNGSLKFENLRNLYLGGNEIEEIQPNALVYMKKLKTLDLSRNRLRALDYDLFRGKFYLEKLNLSNNLIELVEASLLRDIKALKVFDLDNNFIKIVPEFFFLSQQVLENVHLSQYSMLHINNASLVRLDSVVNIYFNISFYKSQSNIQNTLDSLEATLFKNMTSLIYYKSLNIILEPDDQIDYDIEYCMLVLKFIKFKLHLNLNTDKSVATYLSNCLSTSLYQML